MHTGQVLMYLLAIVLLTVAAFGPAIRVSLALLGAAAALLAYALSVITA